MNIQTKYNIGDLLDVRRNARRGYMENSRGRVIEICVTVSKGKSTEFYYTLEFVDLDTGEVEPDWNETYEEDDLKEAK